MVNSASKCSRSPLHGPLTNAMLIARAMTKDNEQYAYLTMTGDFDLFWVIDLQPQVRSALRLADPRSKQAPRKNDTARDG